MTDLRIGDAIFNVTVEGDATKPPLMLSHSLGIDLSMWNAQMAALLEHFRVVRYDTRGHGGSAGMAGAVSIAQLGRDALAILDALEIERVHWIGLSLGGVIGQWLLINALDRVDRVVLANTAAKLGTPDGWNQRIVGMLAGDTDAAADATMERWFSADFTQAAPDSVAAIDSVLRNTDPRGYVACCAALRDLDLRQALLDRPQIADANVLVITGHDDPVISSADTAFLTRAFTSAKHVALDARHISNIEAEAAFTAAVVEFLTAKPVRRKTPPPARLAKPTPTIRRPPKSRSTAARVPLKSSAAPVVPKATTTTASKPAVTRSKATKAGSPKPARKAAPAKATGTARAGIAKSARAPSRTAIGKASTAKPAATKVASAGTVARKGTAARKGTTARRGTTARKGMAAKTAISKTKPVKSSKGSAAKTVSARRKPATIAIHGDVKTPSASKRTSTKTASIKTAKAKPASAKAGKILATKTTAIKTTASRTATSKATKAKRTIAKAPTKKAIAPKAKTASKGKTVSKAKTTLKARTAPKTASKSAPSAKASTARRNPASSKPGRPAGRRKP